MQNLFKRLFLLCFLGGLPSFLYAQSLTDSDPEITTYRSSSGSTYTVYVEDGSSGATTESNAHKVYIPIYESGNNGYHTDSSTNSGDDLPTISDTDANSGDGNVVFSNVSLSWSGGADYIHLAVADGNEWEIVYKSGTQSSSGDKTITVPIMSFCNGDLECDDFNDTVTTVNATESATFYMFASSVEIDVGTDVDITDTSNYPGIDTGVFYDISLSNKISSDEITLNSISKGDTQVIVNFSGFGMSNVRSLYFYAVRGASSDATCPLTEDGISTTVYGSRTQADTNNGQASVNKSLDYTSSSGIVTVEDLENSYCYSARVYYRDKFGFASLLSKRINQTPENIETLLATQQCYLLTAGFNGDHPVVRFFRDFRDTVLMKFWLGRSFINFYYETAPQYTGYILKTPWLQMMIRSISTSLYYTLRFWQASLFFLFLMVLGYTLRRIRLI